MKREHATIVRNTIKEIAKEDKNWKWSLKGNTIRWSYEPEFEIVIGDIQKDEDGDEYQIVKTVYQCESWVYTLVGKCFWTDYQTVEEALEAVTKMTMKKAMRMF